MQSRVLHNFAQVIWAAVQVAVQVVALATLRQQQTDQEEQLELCLTALAPTGRLSEHTATVLSPPPCHPAGSVQS